MPQDTQLHVTEWGQGHRVVLVHGGTPGGGAVSFAAQKELEQRWHLVLPDRPGHGLSPRQGQEDFERDAELLLPLLGKEQSHLVGHSYGAIVAMCMAVRRPHTIQSLTLIEPPAFCFAPDNPAVTQMARANRELFETPPSDPADFLQTFFNLVGIRIQVPKPLPAPLLGIAKDLTDIRGPDEAEIAAADLTAGGYPICVLTSGNIAGFEGIAEAIAKTTGAEHIVVPGADHAVQNQGELVNRILEQFWSSSEAA
jgi:pimeloyl-ACP methyl ester carboxylesterase